MGEERKEMVVVCEAGGKMIIKVSDLYEIKTKDIFHIVRGFYRCLFFAVVSEDRNDEICIAGIIDRCINKRLL